MSLVRCFAESVVEHAVRVVDVLALVAHGNLFRIARRDPHMTAQCFDGGSVDASFEDLRGRVFTGECLDDVGNNGLAGLGDVLGIRANLDGSALQWCCHVQQSTTRWERRTMQ